MKKLRRMTALLLCMIMLIPSHGLTALAEAIDEYGQISETLPLEELEGEEEPLRIEETLPLEAIEGEAEETSRIEETLALEPIKKNTMDGAIIYWNPGGVLPEELATASNAQAAASKARTATASNAKKGNDDADGRTPSTPVKTLAKALARAEELMAEEELLPSDITIYAMNPMEIADGQLYALNGGNLTIKSWPGRSYDSDVIFYVNGGQLTMMNVQLASGKRERDDEEARLIYVWGGAFQMGKNVLLEGRVVMDYRKETEEKAWETATASDAAAGKATGSNAAANAGSTGSDSGDTADVEEDGENAFDLNEYIFDGDEDSMELIEDSVSASTWRAPIIELLEGFDGGAGEYILELLADRTAGEIELVKTLYSDAETEEEFLGFFSLLKNTDVYWSLQVETQATAQVRNTGLLSNLSAASEISIGTFSLETEILTQKTLVAARAAGTEVYWNPGERIVIGVTTYYAGDDGFMGNEPTFPVKTWEKAVERAAGGTIICMQTLDLRGSTAGDYLPTEDGDSYLLKSSSAATKAALSAWPANPQPAICVPAGKTLVLQDVVLVGVKGTSAQAIVCDKGNIIINENVIAENGYIQITASQDLKEHPVKVTSIKTGMITLLFSGINNNYDYCYTDVVIPHDALADRITNAEAMDADEGAAEADLVGKALLDCFQLHSSHRDDLHNGSSKFDWKLRQDTNEDDEAAKVQNLELYAEYYFDALYLDGVRGNDSYYGATCQYPVKTWEKVQERWAFEMQKSVDARWNARYVDGKDAAYIEEFYPLPKTIYICGTVTVNDTELWDLRDEYKNLFPAHIDSDGNPLDYDGKVIGTEVVPHMDIPYEEGGSTLIHVIPTTLVEVKGGGVLTINDVTFRNITDDAASVTILLKESGSCLTLKGNTLLTGQRLAKGSVTAKAVTLGTHVKVEDKGNFVMGEEDAPWKGAIEKRQYGVNALGTDTTVTMHGGSIRENNSFDQTLYDKGTAVGQKLGAGVLLSAGAKFTMNGGKITGNTVYQYGAGVYMTDTGTSFVMKNGEISKNEMAVNTIHKDSSSVLRGAGIGIYAGSGTVLEIGEGSLITGNTGYLTDGVGVWSNGSSLTVNGATISANSIGGYSTSAISYGIGIYVGGNVEFSMNKGEITDNITPTNAVANVFGAGIYFASGTKDRSISDSVISRNKVNYEYWSDYDVANMSRGGGIYIVGGNLNIEDSEISYNEACLGGGICSYAESSGYRANIEIEKTTIKENKARGYRNSNYGSGGGIYQYYYSTITLKEGVEITKNTASVNSGAGSLNFQRGYGGGGIYICSADSVDTRLVMENETPGGIQINENKSSSGQGGGIYNYYGNISARNVEINLNSAVRGGGIHHYYGSISARNIEINQNTATNYGGGIYHYYGSIGAQNVKINQNTATTYGGGIYTAGAAYGYYKDVEISQSKATDGAGLYLASSTWYYMQDSVIKDNTASRSGGGIYLNSTGAVLHLSETETETGKFKLTGNHAAGSGGGVYLAYCSDLTMNIAGPIQNSANTQGSNFYVGGYGTLNILAGEFKQPKASDQREGVYNFYINDQSTGTSTYRKSFDMKDVTVEPKSGDSSDVIYLNTANSYLTYLVAPPDDDGTAGYSGTFPIDLNTDVFKPGSIAVKVRADSPNGNVTVPVYKPNANLIGATNVPKTYGSGYVDASTNLEYFSGGQVPRRTQLGGFPDSFKDGFTNVVLIAEGVYLSGTGNDGNDGSSPVKAVKTFKKAKEVLEERIEARALQDEGLAAGEEKTGFSPFIYICGQVDIKSDDLDADKNWELNYDAPLFTEANKNYKEAEKAHKDIVYPAQVRRFASFVNAPMIKVGDDSSDVEFSTGKIIIDGMADAVITADQNGNSPVIRGTKRTTVTLNTESQIKNNYYSGLDIYGTLVLTGDENASDSADASEGYNKQVYNHHGSFVRLYESSKMDMKGGARILADSAKKVGAQLGIGIEIAGKDVSVSMSGDSGIEQGSGSSLLGDYGIYNGISGYANTSIGMSGKASITTADRYMSYGIYLQGADSKIKMEYEANITLTGAGTQQGIYTNTTGTSNEVIMQDKANIALTATGSYYQYGITVTGTDNKVTMRNSANITLIGSYGYGIQMAGTRSTVSMREDSSIKNGGTASSYYYGIYIEGTNPVVEMLNDAVISGGASGTSGYGIYVNATGANVSMNMDGGDIKEGEDSAKIVNTGVGNYITACTGYSLSMGKNACISNSATGIQFYSGTSTTTAYQVSMEGYSKICDNTSYGVYFYYGNITTPVNIQMKDYAAIEKNRAGGIYERYYSSSSYGMTKFNLEMEDKSRISGNGGYGIGLAGYRSFTATTGYHNITLTGSAKIGGDSYYNANVGNSGNSSAGIYANSPIQLVMSGDSKISWNGSSDTLSSATANGVYLTRDYTNGSAYYRSGTAKITLNENASICKNRGGVYVATISGTTYPNYPNTCVIELNGEGMNLDGTPWSPSIQENTNGVYIGEQGTIRLKGGAILGEATSLADKRSLECYGYLELDGRSSIEGRVYLRDGNRPITMTNQASGSADKYKLYLAEGFLGQIVVKPDALSNGDPAWDLTTPVNQRSYFYKDGADGMAADKYIRDSSPNLILEGENDVYLSGSGNDNNTGNSKSTPVRTFKRAKELLETKGYFTTGANIIICTSTVQVLAVDANWSFGTGGMVTNTGSGHTWKPLVIRDSDYNGILITLVAGTSITYASTVTFKNITIDGGAAERSFTSYTNDWLLQVGYNKTAILGEGAVLQNNKAVSTTLADYSTLGVYVYGGTLEIDGGTITGMERRTTLNTTTGYYFTSAITCRYYNTTYPGKVIMKFGQIVNNTIDAPYMQTNSLLGTIYLDNYCTFEMSDGLISNNTVNSSTTSPCYGGAIVNQYGGVTISGGTIRANQGGRGSAVYCEGTGTAAPGSLTLSGGQITGNTISAAGITAQGAYSPVYINGYSFQLKGGGADIQDGIYLATTNGLITISGQIYQTNRRYRVYLNQGTSSTQFKKGSVVVQPDGNNVMDTTPYLAYFDVRTSPYVLDQGRIDQAAGVNQSAVIAANVKENQCLILMKAVYLDSAGANSSDNNTGLTPATAVKTFTRAKALGGAAETNGTTVGNEHYIIYVSGKATNAAAESSWFLPSSAYMCRYTGFAVYSDSNGTATTNQAYYGSLIEPISHLTLQDIVIYGRRTLDTVTNKGDSLVRINNGIEVSVRSGAILADNYNIGSYYHEGVGVENLSSKGGAFHVAAGGKLQMDDGVIQNTEAADGSAIYLSVSETNSAAPGQLILTGTPDISGKVYLGGTGATTAAYIEPDESYKPSSALQLSIANDYNRRPVVQYPTGITPGVDELEHYLFDDAVKAMYDVVNKEEARNVFELNMRQVIYLDGQNGDDDDTNHDGSTPQKAFKTLEKVYKTIGIDASRYGIVVFVVDTVEVSGVGGGPAKIEMMNILVKEDHGNNHYEGYYWDSNRGDINNIDNRITIRGQVYFKRYAQPKDYSGKGYDVPTLEETLFDVKDGGTLTMKGIYLDGHSKDADNSDPTLVAKGVTASSPLVTVRKGGILHCLLAEGTGNLVPTATRFTNNINKYDRAEDEAVEAIGKLNESDIKEGSSAGIELLGGEIQSGELMSGGECHLENTEFNNLQLENVRAGGTDVYSNGDLHISAKTHFTGTVYLEGLWTAEDQTAEVPSRYITVDAYGIPAATNFQVLMRDPYMGRDVVHYPDMTKSSTPDVEPPLTDTGYYRLEDRIKDHFCLYRRSEVFNYIFELAVPVAVYIDGTGIKGDDGYDVNDPTGRVVGSTPAAPVKSLHRAFELLSTRGGNTIYVVGTIQVSANTEVTGMSYVGTEGTVLLDSTNKVKITRYIQPDFAYHKMVTQAEIEAAGYDVPDFTGALLSVTNGATARFGSGVYFDGHSEKRVNTEINEYGDEALVDREPNEAKAPMITVESGSTLTLSEGTTLQDNYNTYADGDSAGQNGGAIANSGTVNVNGALFENNIAGKGSVVYQNGTFNIQSKPENLSNHKNAFYLTTLNSGTTDPINNVIRTAVAIPEDMVFDVDMDNAVKVRPVVQFTDPSAYSPNTGADAEHEHFKLGINVSPELFLVESEGNAAVLELQNWEYLDVTIPTHIYLVMAQKKSYDVTRKLQGIQAEADSLFSAPEYRISNNKENGKHDVKVSIISFKNQTRDLNIKANPADGTLDLVTLMNLTGSAEAALGSTDLYLAVKGLPDADEKGFSMVETPLQPYAEENLTAVPAVLGTLTPNTSGDFTFIGAVANEFMETYDDPRFPFGGSTIEAQKHMDGRTDVINARAKYLLRYRVEIVPSRRESTN